MEKIFEKKKLLLVSYWTTKDIMLYYGVERTTAWRIKEKAIKHFNGSIPYGDIYVSTEAVLNVMGTNRKKELELLTLLGENENAEKVS